MIINRASRFKRAYKKLPRDIQDDFCEKIEIFVQNPYDLRLHTHKLKGKLEECYAFCLKNGFRTLFVFTIKGEVNLISIGSHNFYNRWKM